MKIDQLLSPRGQIPQATILYNESKHNILASVGNANKTMKYAIDTDASGNCKL